MAKSVACQSLGEMSTPSRAAAGLTRSLGFQWIAREITWHKSIVICKHTLVFSFIVTLTEFASIYYPDPTVVTIKF
jgi:hypothetical protein